MYEIIVILYLRDRKTDPILMYIQALTLFSTTLLSGLFAIAFPKKFQRHRKLLLIFGGSFLFSLTLVDILPLLYRQAASQPTLLYYLLIGFFFQFFLDLLSHGIAHGHTHSHSHLTSAVAPIGLLSALFIHALFDGLLLSGVHHLSPTAHAHNHSLLSGVLLHKIPATLSFVTILLQHTYSRKIIFTYLFIFAIASPIGCLLPAILANSHTLTHSQPLLAIFAISIGNLLHIASTILSEANPNHHFNLTTLAAYLSGAALAVVATLS